MVGTPLRESEAINARRGGTLNPIFISPAENNYTVSGVSLHTRSQSIIER